MSHGVWLYNRCSLSYRDVEERMVERGVTVSYESVRYWCPSLSVCTVEQEGHVLDTLVQRHRDEAAAKAFFRKLLEVC
jgi:putative transposase